MKKFMEKPFTWGSYMKLCGVCSLISVLMGAAYYVAFCTNAVDSIREKLQGLKERIGI